MGIKSFTTLYKLYNLNKSVPLSYYSGKKVAIDSSILFMNYWKVSLALKISKIDVVNQVIDDDIINSVIGKCMTMLLQFIKKFTNNNITPVFVLDGKPPEEKKQTISKRTNMKEKSQNDFIECVTSESFESSNEQMLNRARRKLVNFFPIPKKYFSACIELLTMLDITCMRAKGEAERLCATLCREGICAAVYTSDTDVFVHGCPEAIISMTDYECNVVSLYDIITSLGFTFKQFVDFAIMCGCDYNTNIKGIGIKRSLEFIRRFECIENLPKNIDISCLNHIKCRELFTHVPSNELIDMIYVKTDNIDTFVDKYHIDKALLVF